MPSIPRFHVTQDAAFVYVHVNVPYVRVSEMEFHVEGLHFSFYCKPYLLKLQFPHEVVDDDLAKAVYDPNVDNGTITVHLPKKDPGQHFEDLDLITKLLQPKKAPVVDLQAKSAPAPLIEVLDSQTTDTTESATHEETEQAADGGDATLLELEKRFAEAAAAEEEELHHVKVSSDLSTYYGFNNVYKDVFRSWHGEASEIVSLPDPDVTPADRRRSLREEGEDMHFDVERYLLDYANADEDYYYEMAMTFVPFWRQYPVIKAPVAPPARAPLIMEVSSSTPEQLTQGISGLSLDSDASTSVLSDADRELLLRLPNKEFLISRGSKEEDVLLGGLADILAGFAYEQLTTQGDSGIESTWTISILSPTLAWLDSTDDVRAIVRSAVRRILAFPLLRQYKLAIHVLRETAELLRRGKRVVLKSLLELYRIVEKSETQYLLNSIYVQDYCIWIQSVDDQCLVRLAHELSAAVNAFKKAETGWALEEMERRLEQDECEDEGDEESSSEESDSSDNDSEAENDSSAAEPPRPFLP